MSDSTLYLTDTIREVDELPCSHPASVNIDVANYYYCLTKMIRPLLVVEIGCFIGFSTLHFAQALREQGFGKMISIDAFDWEVDAGHGLENRHDVALRYREKSRSEDIVTFIKGYSTEVYPSIEKDIKNKIDLLYIDGDHTIVGVFKDFNTYYNDVREGGFVILHDIYPSMCGEFGPRALIDHLKSTQLIPKSLELIEMPTRDGFGIAVLRKTSSDYVKATIPATAVPKSHIKRAIRKIKGKYLFLRKVKSPDTHHQVQIKVVDSRTQKPISGAVLICPQRWDEKRVTDETGTVYLNHYLPNRYLFNALAKDYSSVYNFLIDIEPNKSMHEYTIMLERK